RNGRECLRGAFGPQGGAGVCVRDVPARTGQKNLIGACAMRIINALALTTILLGAAGTTLIVRDKPAGATPSVAVGSQYDTAHVYVAPSDVARLSDSLIATFGGTKSD